MLVTDETEELIQQFTRDLEQSLKNALEGANQEDSGYQQYEEKIYDDGIAKALEYLYDLRTRLG
jgi:hypothetical protein